MDSFDGLYKLPCIARDINTNSNDVPIEIIFESFSDLAAKNKNIGTSSKKTIMQTQIMLVNGSRYAEKLKLLAGFFMKTA